MATTEKKTAAAKTATVHHPELEGISYEVPAGDVDRWAAAGWRKTPLASSDGE